MEAEPNEIPYGQFVELRVDRAEAEKSISKMRDMYHELQAAILAKGGHREHMESIGIWKDAPGIGHVADGVGYQSTEVLIQMDLKPVDVLRSLAESQFFWGFFLGLEYAKTMEAEGGEEWNRADTPPGSTECSTSSEKPSSGVSESGSTLDLIKPTSPSFPTTES